MIYLSGAKNPQIAKDMQSGRIGLLNTPSTRYRLDNVAVWAMDNGCFNGKYPGDDRYLSYLGSLEAHRDRCLFVAIPDVVGDAERTLNMFPDMARRVSAAGWPVALVGQDGMEYLDVPWDSADWLFVGGSTEWKLGPGAERLIAQAKARGKRVHIGRVNSGKRYTHFAALGCDSADGTFIAFDPPTNADYVRRWVASTPTAYLWGDA